MYKMKCPRCHNSFNPHKDDLYKMKLGSLITNLHSLEFILRIYLQKLIDAKLDGVSHAKSIYEYPEGSKLPVNEITNYDSLTTIIKKYNKQTTTQEDKIYESIIKIRDALAHGRVSSATIDGNQHLIKFGPRDKITDTVTVEFNEILSVDFLSKYIKLTHETILKLALKDKALGN